MIGEHDRKDGHLEAWKALNASVAEDLHAKRGSIKPVRSLFAYYDSKIHTVSERAMQALKNISPFRRRA